jgi:uncharacterized membrane protein YjdF
LYSSVIFNKRPGTVWGAPGGSAACQWRSYEMDGFIDRIADFILSVIGKKTNTDLDKGRRREASIWIAAFLFIVFGMCLSAVYNIIKMIVGK